MLRNNNVGFKPLNVLPARFPRPKDATALTAISVIMDKQIEPWQQKTKGWFKL